MWIEQIFVESFGLIKGLSIPDLKPGITLVIGPNEAGKSTLLEFVRSIFFGFRNRNSRSNTYDPPDGSHRSGWIAVRLSPDERLRVQRIERAGMKEGRLSVWDQEGNCIEPSRLPLFGPSMSRSVYEKLFAFDLDQMRHLDKETLRSRIVSAALGSLDVNPLQVVKRLDERLKALARRTTKNSDALWAIQTKIADLDRRLKLLEQRPERYAWLREHLTDLTTKREQLYALIHQSDEEVQRVSEVLRYEKEWKRLLGLDEELLRLEDVRDFPADGVIRLNRLLEQKREVDEALQEQEATLETVLGRLGRIVVDHTVLENSGLIQSLARQASLLTDRPSEMARNQAGIAKTYASQDEELAQLGPGWDRQRLARTDPSAILEQRVRSFADSWRVFQEKIRDLEFRLSDSRERLQRLEQKRLLKTRELQRVAPYCRGFLEPKVRDRLLQWKQCLARIGDLQDRLRDKKRQIDSLARERESLRNALADMETDDASPLSQKTFATFVIMVGAAGIGMMYGAYRNPDATAMLFLALGITLLGLIPSAMVWKIRWDRARRESIKNQRDGLRRTLEDKVRETAAIETTRRECMYEVQKLRATSQGIATEVLGHADASAEDVARAEQRSAAAEEYVRRRRILEENIEELGADNDIELMRRAQLSDSADLSRSEFAELRTQWTRFLDAQGLDENLDPEMATELIRRLRDLKTRQRQISEQETFLASISEEWHEFSAAVSGLAASLGTHLNSACPLDLVEHWVRLDDECRQALIERNGLEEQARDHRRRLGVLRQRAQQTAAQIGALLKAGGAEDEEGFLEQARRYQRYDALKAERKILAENLVHGLRCDNEQQLCQRLLHRDWEADKASAHVLRNRLQRLRGESEEVAGNVGRTLREIETIEAEEETDKLLAEREEWRARLSRKISEWLTHRLARGLLEKTLEVYEREKQPRVLESGARYLASMAGERFARILIPMDRDHLILEYADGRRVDEEHLSRGTLEQVYLALRLAHVDMFRGAAMNLPFVMDDVLVNFDSHRARRTAETLAAFAEDAGVQILFFSCHSEVLGLFPEKTATFRLECASGLLAAQSLSS